MIAKLLIAAGALILLAGFVFGCTPAFAGSGFMAGFGQGMGQMYGGMPAQPYYYTAPAVPPLGSSQYDDPGMFSYHQQEYTFPGGGTLRCRTFQGAFNDETTCR